MSASPTTAGIAAVTTFTFTAVNFVARSGSLRFSWDFGDGSSDSTTTAQTTHRYQGAGTFAVRVFGADPQGVIDTASASGVRVVNLSGSWAFRDPAGNMLFDNGISLTQDGALLRGDVTGRFSCLVGITGSVTPTGTLTLSFTEVRVCPSTFELPLPSSFTGRGDAPLDNFDGTLTGWGSARISRCTNLPNHPPCG